MADQITFEEKKTDVVDVEKALTDAAENERLQDEEDKKKIVNDNGVRYHESHTDRRTVRSILKRYADHEIVIPACQRLYVWSQKQRDGLMDSIRKGLPCGSVTLCTLEDGNDTLYLIDGLQRLTSLLLMSNDKSLSDEDRAKVSNYQLGMELVYNMTLEEMSEYFIKKNSGIAVSAAAKSNAALPTRIQEAGLKLSRNEFFQNIADKANATFSKNEHNKVIGWNILLACAGVAVESIKSADITKRLTDYESDVMAHEADAEKLVERLSEVYAMISDDKFIKRSMNANFVSILVYVIHDHFEFTNEQIVNCIATIFEKGKAIPKYCATTSEYSASADSCKKRYDVILNVLESAKEENKETEKPVDQDTHSDFDDAAYHEFCKSHNGKVINTKSEDYPVDFADVTDEERKQLYTFYEVEKNVNKYEGMIMKIYNRIAKETEKESA